MGMIIQNGKVFSGEPKTTYTERVLWSGSETPALSPGTDITLSDDLYSYDEIVIETYNSTYNQHAIIPFTTSFLQVGTIYLSVVNQVIGLGAYIIVNSGNSIKIKRISSSSESALTYLKIIGIKYGDTVKRKDYHVYSTDEKIVGEWIDGSTLYERTYNVSSLSSSSILIDSNITSETAKIRNTSYGSYRLSGGGFNAQYVSHTSSSLFARIVFNPNGLYANIEGISSGVTASDFDITIRYTKSS